MNPNELAQRAEKLQTDVAARLAEDPQNETLLNRDMEIRNLRNALRIVMERNKLSDERLERLDARLLDLETHPLSAGNHTQFIGKKGPTD